jgi:glycosyltransferase involved in cell wall biosynthesis
MKIALVCDWYLPRVGGQELHMRDLAIKLNQLGHEAHIICTTPGPALQDGIRVHRLKVPILPRLETFFLPSTLNALDEVLTREGFDVVHGHAGFSPLAHAATWIASWRGIPSVFTEHSVLRGPAAAVFSAIRTFCPVLSWPTVLAGVSQFVVDDLRRITGRDDVFVLHNGVEPGAWLPRCEDSVQRVVSVMRFTRRKRPEAIVAAIPRILERLPRELWPRFTIAGDGPRMATVQAEARRLGVEEHLDLPGLLPRDQVAALLSRASVFLLPTIKESLSIATLEAMSAGVPVVATSRGGVGDIITSGVDGFLADSGEQMIEHVVALLRDPALRQQVARNGRQRVQHFSWAEVVPRHLALYRLALERFRRDTVPDIQAMVA